MSIEHENNIDICDIAADQADELLKLDNQLCFAFYVCSKEIIKKYRPLLSPFGLTYTGYIALLALWEKDNVTVKELGERLYLDSGTLTPLLKKLEELGYIRRLRSENDERNVYAVLTDKGRELKKEAAQVPVKLAGSLGCGMKKAGELLEQLRYMMKLITEE